MPVAIERDVHARVAHVGRDLLDVQARSDHEGRRGVPGLVKSDRLEPRPLPRRARPPAHRRGVEGVRSRRAEQEVVPVAAGAELVGGEPRGAPGFEASGAGRRLRPMEVPRRDRGPRVLSVSEFRMARLTSAEQSLLRSGKTITVDGEEVRLDLQAMREDQLLRAKVLTRPDTESGR